MIVHVVVLLLPLLHCPVFAVAGEPMMRFPDIHRERVTFSVGGNIWVADLKQGKARQLTSHVGREYFPKFSPDGNWIAFTSEVTGRPQVYIVPYAGGEARQLTHYPSQVSFYPSKAGYDDQVLNWTPDGKFVLYRSTQGGNGTIARFFKVPRDGGWPEPLPLAEAGHLSYAPDGKRLVFHRTTTDFNLHEAWKGYRGGLADDIWMFDLKKNRTERLTTWEGTDQYPMWMGNEIYFVSDRSGLQNIFQLNPQTRTVVPVTSYTDFAVQWPSDGPGGAIVFEKGGILYRLNISDRNVEKLSINIPLPLEEVSVNGADYLESISPGPKETILFGARGEVFHWGKSGVANITETSNIREKDVVLDATGERAAYLADFSGSDELYWSTIPNGEPQPLTRNSPSLPRKPSWSPDGTRVAYHDVLGGLHIAEVNGSTFEVDRTQSRTIRDYSWAPDGRLLLYSKPENTEFSSLWVFDVQGRKSKRLTDGRFRDTNPVFDPEGKFVWFLSRRDYRPHGGKLEYNFVLGDMVRIYQVSLQDPLTEEAFHNPLPEEIPRGALANLRAGRGFLLYERSSDFNDDPSALCLYDTARKQETVISREPVRAFLAAGGTSLLIVKEKEFAIIDCKKSLPASLDEASWITLDLPMRISLHKEWEQIVREAWRWAREIFYFRDQRAVDWDGLLQRYLPLVRRAADRHDVNYILAELIGHLSVSHLWARGGALEIAEAPGSGLLGAEFEPDANGYFRIVRFLPHAKRSGQRSPLASKAMDVRPGDYVLEIDQVPLRLPRTPYELLHGKAGKIVQIRLGPSPQQSESRTITVSTIASEATLYYEEWVESNRRKVEDASGGRIGYVHIPDFVESGLESFASQYYHQLHREGMIVDARFADGGYYAEAILERLRRVPVGMNTCRTCGTWTYPRAAFGGRLVMLVNQYSSSDGDLFPFFFRKYNLGTVVGMRTWGGVIGGHTIDLVDGGEVGIADNAVTDLTLVPELENRGFVPDVEIDNLPNDVAMGRDDQLEKAIEILLKEVR